VTEAGVTKVGARVAVAYSTGQGGNRIVTWRSRRHVLVVVGIFFPDLSDLCMCMFQDANYAVDLEAEQLS